MIIILFRILLIIAILFIIYTVYKFIVNPRRRLDHAHQKHEFYFHDTPENTKQNFFITYKGLMFEGEKYLGTTEEAFEVVTINIFTHYPEKLQGLERNDLYFLEEQVLIRYPYARIEWKYPINRLNIRPINDDQ
ncbi:sigma-w pathway protein ysdB [Halobacillus naozhouensis]|uniref:Sigma-w pathway protein ysdB n=1 Tax=Halobacillus naozhouensis TaxID=554880 RepID=A0ABY8ITT4_9BACI|nr:sigma-w pathway protein ysdB [Halobacillus naozhouensis]WFT73457.1 sigma-w pathway protein ysdB [Halobacillus naozhouensis]